MAREKSSTVAPERGRGAADGSVQSRAGQCECAPGGAAGLSMLGFQNKMSPPPAHSQHAWVPSSPSSPDTLG